MQADLRIDFPITISKLTVTSPLLKIKIRITSNENKRSKGFRAKSDRKILRFFHHTFVQSRPFLFKLIYRAVHDLALQIGPGRGFRENIFGRGQTGGKELTREKINKRPESSSPKTPLGKYLHPPPPARPLTCVFLALAIVRARGSARWRTYPPELGHFRTARQFLQY